MANEEKADRGYVQYLGASTVRGLTREDLESVGVTGKDIEDIWWNRANKWRVNRNEIPDAVWEVAMKHDPEFMWVGEHKDAAMKPEDAKDREPMSAGMTPMPPAPTSPDFVGGGSLVGGNRGGGTTGPTGTSASGSTGNK
jgi:hypothetical protein